VNERKKEKKPLLLQSNSPRDMISCRSPIVSAVHTLGFLRGGAESLPFQRRRWLSASPIRKDVLSLIHLGDRRRPAFAKTANSKLSSLTWSAPPRNLLIVKKRHVFIVRSALISLAR